MLDGLGRPLDDGPPLDTSTAVPIHHAPPAALERPRITQPLQVGVRVLDTLLTSGRGQRVAILAGSGVGKSSLLSMLVRGTEAECSVLCLVGERGREVSLPLGGIGTGSIGLSGGGRLIDWEIFNRPNKGVTNGISHFAVRAERAGAVIDARILNGPYLGNRTGDFPADTSRNFGFGARRDSLAGMPHFRSNTFEGRFPTADLVFRDERFPGDVGLLAFNPFIPLADRDSSIPVAMFETVTVRSTNTGVPGVPADSACQYHGLVSASGIPAQ